MKNSLFNIIVLLLVTVMQPLTGQVRQGNMLERIQEKKKAFFNEKLQLTPKESDQFWPLYNDYSNRKNLINQQRNSLMAYYIQNEKNLSDKEMTETLEELLDFQRQETSLMESYTKKFKEFLPDSKIIKIFVTELQFKKLLLTQSIRPRPNTR
jgi:hypothetical protein